MLRPSTTDIDAFQEVILQEVYRPWFKPITSIIESECGVDELSKRALLIIDCGANVGLTSLYFRLLFPNSEIVSVEADRDNFRALCEQGFATQVRPVWGAINDRAEELFVDRSEYGAWGMRVTNTNSGSAVQSVCINDLLAQTGCAHLPFLVKIDIEGSEDRLFRTNLEWLDRTPIVVIELHDWMFPLAPVSSNVLKAFADRNRIAITRNGHLWSISRDLLIEVARRRN